ncbi:MULTISPECIES: Zn(2+)-responsive transcriptional regulator [Marinomonas]|uniref:MerR family Zn(II)-responsive transcriptional regulator of zntA n=2 Tax=Marinomonas TaxID=28253 RepID=A0A366D053_9GAMM|nr:MULTISPECIES: Zn(2+)-responsive transcriptional regulator [Marinomonas]AEF54050.1 transcriptional regulator, MerR family [Marinomonas posidonica IVIA-Po-181]RBO83460.1 MerR family Zn(II)-responsive transcriptional regulator of zntA [Marinomonas aquiplantarum]
MYRIGELATLYKINKDTLRFYEKSGLLHASARSDSGYRLYSEQDKDILHFILRAKGVGFTLAETQELLSIEINKESNSCSDVKQLVDDKLTEIEAKIAELKCFQSSLKKLSDACCGGHESAVHCTILEALEQDTNEVQYESSVHQGDQ